MTDHPLVPSTDADLAATLGVSAEAVALTRSVGVVDLHLDTFIPPRLWGYDPLVAHRGALLGRFWFGHVDLPRAERGGLVGGMWSITTNPLRGVVGRERTFLRNLDRFRALVDASGGRMALVRDAEGWDAARARGQHAVLLSIQGGNAVERSGLAVIPDDLVVRITLVHLTTSSLGGTSSPLHLVRAEKGITRRCAELVQECVERRVLVDLAHIHEIGFWQVVDVHGARQPLVATHTGVDGVRPHWRNLDDRQLKAIAATGGVVGVIFSAPFLTRKGGPRDEGMVLEHMQHIVDVVGDDHVAIGSDFDGMIQPPWALRGAETYPRLTQAMLDRGWSPERIGKALSGNALRCLRAVRPPGWRDG